MNYLFTLFIMLLASSSFAAENMINERQQNYQALGAKDFNGERGKQLWQQKHMQKKLVKEVNCATCHSNNLQRSGSHIRTGKIIEPMALSINPRRYSDSKKIEKWFKRNCKWTWGRECTTQEKGDILEYLKQQ